MVAASLHANSWAQNIHGVMGIHEIGQYLKIWHAIERTAFTDELDHLKLKLTASGTYSGQGRLICMLAHDLDRRVAVRASDGGSA
jgi:hypothetical protein